jgi:hypothetical protein
MYNTHNLQMMLASPALQFFLYRIYTYVCESNENCKTEIRI